MADRTIGPIRIPDAFTVWAASDLHGQLRATDALLAAAGLTDGGDRWTAPAGTALVVTGDLVDRGPDSVGLVRRMASLRAQAPAAGSIVALLEGNHEAQVLGGLDGEPAIFDALMAFGGAATLLSAGMTPDSWIDRPPAEIAARLDELAPDLRPTLWTFAPYARWRDLLLVHGGPVPGQDLERFACGAERLWIRSAFFASEDAFPESAPWAAYRDAGFGRVVFGHTSVTEPTVTHGGRALNLDTWRGGRVSLARIAAAGDLAASLVLSQPAEPRAVADAPVTAEMIRRLDEGLPPVVNAWLDRRSSSGGGQA